MSAEGEGEIVILDDVRWVVERSRHVQIDRSRLAEVCAGLDPTRLRLPDWQVPVVPSWRDERLVDYILLFNSLNFCYWGEPKWTIIFRGRPYDGAYGLMGALTRALDEGYPLLEGAFLARITLRDFRHILRGNVPIPLEAERLAIWQEVGPVLVREFGGRWHNLVGRAGGSAIQLVRLLVEHFPSFDDRAGYDGRQVAFYKRAQLAAGMLYQAFGGQGWGALADFERLTVYADYKLPQVLRKLGILVYDRSLATLVDGQTPLAAGSRMEVEIRAATVWASELMRQELRSHAPNLTASHIDFWLWEAGQAKSPGDRPYHRTLTTAY
jgi:hypothetical protein